MFYTFYPTAHVHTWSSSPDHFLTSFSPTPCSRSSWCAQCRVHVMTLWRRGYKRGGLAIEHLLPLPHPAFSKTRPPALTFWLRSGSHRDNLTETQLLSFIIRVALGDVTGTTQTCPARDVGWVDSWDRWKLHTKTHSDPFCESAQVAFRVTDEHQKESKSLNSMGCQFPSFLAHVPLVQQFS